MGTLRLRSNTFVALLIRAGRQELSSKPEWGESNNNITRAGLLADLLRLSMPSYHPKRPETLVSYFSKFIQGNPPNSPSYLPFNSNVCRNGLADRINKEYSVVLCEMDVFCKKYLLLDDYANRFLVGGIIDAIIGDETFYGRFDIGEKLVKKDELDNVRKIALQPFLATVWSCILKNYPDTCEGADTYLAWSKDAGFNTPRTVDIDIGTERAKKITVSTELPKLETTEDTADGTPDNVKNEEPEPVIVEAAPQQKDFTDQTLYNNGRIYNQHAEKIVNIEHVDVLNI